MNNVRTYKEKFSETEVHTFKERLVANVLTVAVLLGITYNASREPRVLPEEPRLRILEEESLVPDNDFLGNDNILVRRRVNKRPRETKMDLATL